MSFSVGSVVSHFDSFSLGLKIYKSVCVLFFFSSAILLILHIFSNSCTPEKDMILQYGCGCWRAGLTLRRD